MCERNLQVTLWEKRKEERENETITTISRFLLYTQALCWTLETNLFYTQTQHFTYSIHITFKHSILNIHPNSFVTFKWLKSVVSQSEARKLGQRVWCLSWYPKVQVIVWPDFSSNHNHRRHSLQSQCLVLIFKPTSSFA